MLIMPGIERTGVVVGCLRKLQSWSYVAAVHEYRSFAAGALSDLDEQVIDEFEPSLFV
jgi:hypothetical protein